MRLLALASRLAPYLVLASVAFFGLRQYVPVRVTGGSMYPALRSGDIALVGRRAPLPGEIALIDPAKHGPVLHRVLKRLPDGSLRTKGDANEVEDFAPTPAGEVRGTVLRVVPFGALLERWRGSNACDTLTVQLNSTR